MFRLRVASYLQVRFARNMHLLQDKAFVNGDWITAASGKTFEVNNPATGKVITSVPNMNGDDVQKSLEAAKSAFESWQHTTAKERAGLLRKWFNLLEKHSDSIAKIITAESGKPLRESKAEMVYGNSFVEFFSEECRRINGEIIPEPVKSKRILVERLPIGVAALITPWNFPVAMITRKAAAALAAGCTCVIKPSEDTPLTALAAAKLAEEAGIPKGVVNVVTCDRPNAAEVGNLLCTSDLIAGISFTGSTNVGKILYKLCASGVKRLGLELGGNAPFIVFESADVDHAVKGAIIAKFRNCGQACIAANRFLVHSKIKQEFVEKFAKAMDDLKLGDGYDDTVNIGPLINKMQYDKIVAFVEDAKAKGAKVVRGGKPAQEIGPLHYHPTLLTNITENMMVYHDELFGPIAPVIPFETEEEALCIANNTRGGLAGYFYSENVGQIFRVSRKLEVGMVGVNEGLISAAEAPFGGIKESGIGREGSHHGLEEYTYYKYICVGNVQ